MEIDTNVTQMLEEVVEGQEIILEPEEECREGEVIEIIEVIEELNDDNVIEHVEEVEEYEQVEEEQIEEERIEEERIEEERIEEERIEEERIEEERIEEERIEEEQIEEEQIEEERIEEEQIEEEQIEEEQIEEEEQVEEEEQLKGEEQIEEEQIEEEHVIQRTNGVYAQEDIFKNKQIIYATSLQDNNIQEKSHNQIHYDASADWEDEEYEQEEQNNVQNDSNEFNTYETYNNGVNAEDIDINERTESSEAHVNYEHTINPENNIEESDSQQEIVQNSENNLIYTVLGSKKQIKSTQENKSDIEFVEIQSFKDGSLPEDGTIYYAVNNEDGTYVQAVEDEQYQYVSEEPMEQDNQEWESSNQNTEADQQEHQEQDQIFLHEDEDGQLYFKNEHGQLQPVYLTPDGNYAIAENSSDEQENQEGINEIQEEQVETENYVLPDLNVKKFNSKKEMNNQSQDNNEDNTVTISLIISEDENGQKRTQVIIPTPAESKCNICNKTFKTSLQLLKHNRLKHAREEDITTRNFPCDLCPKRFSDQNSLARHRKTHIESRLFQCLECHQSFPTASTLRKHLITHNPDSHPLPCIYCGRRFSDKASLMKHEQSHLAGERKTHACDICQKCFSNPTDLNIHKKNHDPDRKFDCEVCGREFNRLNNLQRHMMVHEQQSANEEILSCNVCGITYKFSSSLTRHMVTTHMNPEKLRQQAEEQRRKREHNYRRYLENRKTYETQQPKRAYRRSTGRLLMDDEEEVDEE